MEAGAGGIAAISFATLALVSAWGWWQMKTQAESLSVQVLSEQAKFNAGETAGFIQDVQLLLQGLADSREVASAVAPADALGANRRFAEKYKSMVETVLIGTPDGMRMTPDGATASVSDRIFFSGF